MIPTTLLLIIEATCLYFPLVLGAYISISLMKIPDLSIETAYVCGGIFGSLTLFATSGLPLFVSLPLILLASMVGGMAVGATASLFTHQARFPHLLSSIITIGIFHGLNQFFLGSTNISVAQEPNVLGLLDVSRRFPELPEFIIALLFFGSLAFFFFRTQLGTSLAVYGNNPSFFENYGISTKYIFFVGIMLSSGLAGLAGFFDVEHCGFVDVGMGYHKTLFCITSIILGKTVVQSSKPYSIWIPFVGTLTYFSIIQLLLQVDFNLRYFTMIQSIIIACILTYNFRSQRRSNQHLGI